MGTRKRRSRGWLAAAIVLALLLNPAGALADEPGFHGPLFGLGTDHDGNVLVAEAGRGVVSADGLTTIAFLPDITDVAASDRGWLWAVTGAPDAKLYKVYEDGTVLEFADLGAYEAKHNPHPAEVDSNPFSVADLGKGQAVVADAGGNTLLKVNKHGKVKLIAVLPDEVVPTANAKAIVEEIVSAFAGEPVTCATLPDDAPPDAFGICGLPDEIPAEPVATSVAVGPNGDFYVGELKGFPAPTGESKVWRIRWNARNAKCGQSPLCTVAFDGFTSIVDLAYDDGTLYVAEMDEKSWLAVELGLFEELPVTRAGGTINACDNGSCGVVADGVDLLSAITVDGDGDLWYAQLFGPSPVNEIT